MKGTRDIARILIIFAASVWVAACTLARVNLTTDARYPPKDPSEVLILYEKPDRPYEEIGIVSAESNWTTGEAIKAMRAKAAAVGADAIIIKQTGAGYGYILVTGTAIVFTDDKGRK